MFQAFNKTKLINNHVTMTPIDISRSMFSCDIAGADYILDKSDHNIPHITSNTYICEL